MFAVVELVVVVVVLAVPLVVVFELLLVEDEEPPFVVSGAFVFDFVSAGALVVSAGALALASPDLPGPPPASAAGGEAVVVGLAARRAAGAASMNTSRKTWKTVIPRWAMLRSLRPVPCRRGTGVESCPSFRARTFG